MQFGVPNRIVDDWDFKLSEFDRGLRYESDSKDDFESTVKILIWFWSNFDYNRYNFNIILIKINLFWSILKIFQLQDQKRPSKCQLFNPKNQFISKMFKNN